jgi:hypothetical protein
MQFGEFVDIEEVEDGPAKELVFNASKKDMNVDLTDAITPKKDPEPVKQSPSKDHT